MVNKNIIYRYLESLEHSIRKLKNMDLTMEMITGDEDIQDLVDRRMQKAIETCIDIAAHIVATEKLGPAETSSALFQLLAKQNIIPRQLAKQLGKAVGLRNILVHEYTQIDYQLAYNDLDKKLADLSLFVQHIQKYLTANFPGQNAGDKNL